jgi:hypothetical protein
MHGLKTFEPWASRKLRCRGNIHFVFSDHHRDIRVTFRDGRLRADVLNTTNGDTVGTARVSRPGSSSVIVSFDRSLLGSDVASYRWSVHTEWLSSCPRSGGDPASNSDRAPNKGSIRHRL